MVDSRITYLGQGETPTPLPKRSQRGSIWKRLPLALIIIVVLPTLVSAIYFLFIASPRYVSEARFIVRAAQQEQPSTLGVALQGVGISPTSTDSFVVHEYVRSRDALADLSRRYDIAEMLSRPSIDVFSRYPKPGKSASNESLYKAVQSYVTVGYDTATGISTLRVQGFRPAEAQAISTALLDGGESLVNRLNERAAGRAVTDAERALTDAGERLTAVQARLNSFRNNEGIVDPESAGAENISILTELLTTIATLQAERAQLASQAPQSPQLPLIDSRIAAFQSQVAIERGKIAGDSNSLATKVGGYEALVAERTMADRSFAAASEVLDSARIDANRQKLYLERVVEPSLPDTASQPRRLMSILVVFVTSLLFYGIGWLVWAGLKEHRQV